MMPAATDGPAADDRRHDHGVEADAAAERSARIDEADQRAVDAHDAGAAEALQHAADHQHRQRRRDRAQTSEATVKTARPQT